MPKTRVKGSVDIFTEVEEGDAKYLEAALNKLLGSQKFKDLLTVALTSEGISQFELAVGAPRIIGGGIQRKT
jgi:hypothetical protein